MDDNVVENINYEIFENYESEFAEKNKKIVNKDLKETTKEEKNEENLREELEIKKRKEEKSLK
ncbi:MAG: hypothetical protein LBD88_05060 [Candidatus Peribacteria bacterium]|nr:hypothetical protein [Candidatus Peribacteria bacterium]